MSHVYFATNNQDAIRIGYTGDADKNRMRTHEGYGLRGIAFVPAGLREEDRLHEHFAPYRLSRFAPSRSFYQLEVVQPYAQRLLDYQYATPTAEGVEQWGCADFRLWGPQYLTDSHPVHNNQFLLFPTEQYRVDQQDEYETPDEIVEICRRALGGEIDTDPCSNAFANKRIRAKTFFTKDQNGLSRPWLGRVFLNPPYSKSRDRNGDPLAAIFCQKLVNEMAEGRVQEAITVLNSQSRVTKWWPRLVWDHASAHAEYESRINFIGPKKANGGERYPASKNGTVFSYFGEDPSRFAAAFADHMVFRRWDAA